MGELTVGRVLERILRNQQVLLMAVKYENATNSLYEEGRVAFNLTEDMISDIDEQNFTMLR